MVILSMIMILRILTVKMSRRCLWFDIEKSSAFGYTWRRLSIKPL